MGSLESCLLPGESRDFSEDNLVLNSGFDQGVDPYNHGGNYWKSSAYLIRWGEPVDESQDAYGDWLTPAGLSATKHVQEIRYVPGGSGGTDTGNIKYALTTWGAVATSVSWQDDAYAAATSSFYYSGGAKIEPCGHHRGLGRRLPGLGLRLARAWRRRLAGQEQLGHRLGAGRVLLDLLLRQLLRHRQGEERRLRRRAARRQLR